MRLEGAHQLTALAFRAQRGIDLEEGGGADTHHFARDPACARIRGFGDEDHVDIADVVQFPRSAFTHGDDRQVDRARLVGNHRRHGDRESRGEGGVGEVGEQRPDLEVRNDRLVLDGRGEVGRRDDHELVAIGGP